MVHVFTAHAASCTIHQITDEHSRDSFIPGVVQLDLRPVPQHIITCMIIQVKNKTCQHAWWLIKRAGGIKRDEQMAHKYLSL